MDITGRLIQILPETSGESQRGHWVRGGFVIETDDAYPRKVAFTLFGEDRLAMVKQLQLNNLVIVTFSPESREYNDRWYTDLRCVRVIPAGTAMPQPPAAPQPTAYAQPAAAPSSQAGADTVPFAQSGDDDLPF